MTEQIYLTPRMLPAITATVNMNTEFASLIDTNLVHNFYINYIKLSSSTCFERHPLIFRRSMMLIVHVCSLWYSHSVKVNYCLLYNKAIIHFYRMRIPEAAYMYS